MDPTQFPTALIAEDEPLLAAALKAELAQVWPDLKVLALVGDGASAVTQALQLQPDVLFFDIRMPALSGLEAAVELADAWNTDTHPDKPFPALVFVTAYDQYAMAAFEAQAMDYLLKPVQTARLQKTVSKLQLALANRNKASLNFETTLAQLRGLMGASAPSAAAPLKIIQASVGSAIRMLPVADVVYFEAADKYVRVLSSEREYLIRTPLKELLPQLDTGVFWQIHRGTVVNSSCIEAVTRDEAGKLSVSLRGRREKLPVSRLYVHLFKAM
jgi:DNA-binding LytR/AlgR family response regulator